MRGQRVRTRGQKWAARRYHQNDSTNPSFGATSPRFLAVPAWEGEAEVRSAAAGVGFDFVPVYTAYRRDGVPTIVVYALEQHPRAWIAPGKASPVMP